MFNLKTKFGQWVMFILLGMIWGASFIMMKHGLKSYTNLQVAALRMSIASLVLLPIAIRHIQLVTKKNLKSLLIVGYVGNGIPAMLYATGQTQVNSALAGMLNSLTPLFAMIVGLIFYKNKVKWINIAGILIGLVGAIGLIMDDTYSFISGQNVYALLIVLATLGYGINVNEVKYRLQGMRGDVVIALGFMLVLPVALTAVMITGLSPIEETPDYLINLGHIVILSIVSSALCGIGYYLLLNHTTALFAASITYIIPFFAILWGMFDGEDITVTDFIWIFVILLGVFFVNKNKNK